MFFLWGEKYPFSYIASPDAISRSSGLGHGFIEVLAQYGKKVEEEYIDLVSILENLYIDPESYLASIKKVEVSYV